MVQAHIVLGLCVIKCQMAVLLGVRQGVKLCQRKHLFVPQVTAVCHVPCYCAALEK